jgi:hypothetical protein
LSPVPSPLSMPPIFRLSPIYFISSPL